MLPLVYLFSLAGGIWGISISVTVKPGETVTLQCHDPSRAAIELVQWSRRDLESEGDVLFYRHGRTDETNQHPLFHDRVELRDPQMKDGDASIILKNINVNDTGTYDCKVICNNKESRESVTPQLSTIHLMVINSGGGAGLTGDGGDEDGGDEDGGDKDGSVLLPVTLSVVFLLLLLVAVGLLIYRERFKQSN